MKLTRTEIQAARHTLRKLGHCTARHCGCHMCIAAHALWTYEQLNDLVRTRRMSPLQNFGDTEWLDRIEKYLEYEI